MKPLWVVLQMQDICVMMGVFGALLSDGGQICG